MVEKKPSLFAQKFYVGILEKEYKHLRTFVMSEEGLAVVGLGVQIKELLPDWFVINEVSINFMLLSIFTAIITTIFLVGAQIYRGNFMIARRLALVSIFFLGYGVSALIPPSFEYRIIIHIIIFAVLAYQIIREITYIRNCFRETVWMGIYCLGLNIFAYGVILFPPIHSLIRR